MVSLKRQGIRAGGDERYCHHFLRPFERYELVRITGNPKRRYR